MSYITIKQTKVSGSGRRTSYRDVPTNEEVKLLRIRGFDAKLINIAPRGGAWGICIQVPTKQSEKALRALDGEPVFANRKAAKAFQAEEHARMSARAEAIENIIIKKSLLTMSDIGGLKVSAETITLKNNYVRKQDNAYIIPNGCGDGLTTVKFIVVKDVEKRFSLHEAFGNTPPTLRAIVSGKIKIYTYDCGTTYYEVISTDEVKIFSLNRKVYVVSKSLQFFEIPKEDTLP